MTIIDENTIRYKKKKYKRVMFRGIYTNYFVSKYADVISIKKNGKVHEMKIFETKVDERKSKYSKNPNKKKQGYLYVKLTINGKSCAGFLHRLVATAYIPNPKNKPEVNHKDADHYNNFYKNLEWCTNLENKKHAKNNSLFDAACCEDHAKALYDNKTIEKCCKLMMKNKLSLKEISEKTNVSMSTIYQLRIHNAYAEITSKYDFPEETIESHTPYSDDLIDKACKLKLKGKSIDDIHQITGINKCTLRDVFKGRRRKKFAKKYGFI